MKNPIYNLIIYSINDASGSNDKEYIGLSSFQLLEIIDGYVKIDCQKVLESIFGEEEIIDSNREELLSMTNDMEIAQVFDAQLFSKKNHELVGAITISRTR